MGIGILIVLIVSIYEGRYRLTNVYSNYKDKIFGLYSKYADTKSEE